MHYKLLQNTTKAILHFRDKCSERQRAAGLTRQSLIADRVFNNTAGTPAVGAKNKIQLASSQTDLSRRNVNQSKVDCVE